MATPSRHPSGALDRLVTIERNTPTQDALRNDVDSWASVGDAFARVTYGMGSERRQAAQDAASAPATFEMRQTALTLSITPTDRLRFNGGAWDIHSAIPIERHGVEVIATIRKPGGPT